MSTEELEIAIDGIKLTLRAYEQRDIIEPENTYIEQIEKACKIFLELRNNKIIKTVVDSVPIGKANDIIDLFYKLYQIHYPTYSIVRNKDKDNSTLNLFIKSRMKASEIKRKAAIEECLKIVKILFEEVISSLDRPLDFSMLANAKMSWIIDRAVQILNLREESAKEVAHQKKLDKIIDKYEEEGGTFGILSDIREVNKK